MIVITSPTLSFFSKNHRGLLDPPLLSSYLAKLRLSREGESHSTEVQSQIRGGTLAEIIVRYLTLDDVSGGPVTDTPHTEQQNK